MWKTVLTNYKIRGTTFADFKTYCTVTIIMRSIVAVAWGQGWMEYNWGCRQKLSWRVLRQYNGTVFFSTNHAVTTHPYEKEWVWSIPHTCSKIQNFMCCLRKAGSPLALQLCPHPATSPTCPPPKRLSSLSPSALPRQTNHILLQEPWVTPTSSHKPAPYSTCWFSVDIMVWKILCITSIFKKSSRCVLWPRNVTYPGECSVSLRCSLLK